jgi:hypothetical protein
VPPFLIEEVQSIIFVESLLFLVASMNAHTFRDGYRCNFGPSGMETGVSQFWAGLVKAK